MTDIQVKVGETLVYNAVPKLDDGSVDPGVESFVFGYDDPDSGITTAPDGSNSFTSSGGQVSVTGIAVTGASAAIVGKVDAATGPNQVFVTGTLNATTIEADDTVIATHIEYEPA